MISNANRQRFGIALIRYAPTLGGPLKLIFGMQPHFDVQRNVHLSLGSFNTILQATNLWKAHFFFVAWS